MPAPDVEFLLIAVSVMGGTAGLCFLSSAVARRVSTEQPRLPRWPADVALLCALSASWYAVSMSLTLFNRLLLGYLAKVAFPVSMSISHMAVKGLIATASLLVCGDGSERESSGCRQPQSKVAAILRSQQLSRSVIYYTVLPLGAATALDVWLSAVSISLVDVSVYTVAKSSAIVFTLLFSLLMGLQRLTLPIAASMAAIVAGVVMCSLGADPSRDGGAGHVDTLGVVSALAAAACGAGRWVLTERYFSRPGLGAARPQVLIAVLAPITIVTLLPGLAWEVPRLLASPVPLVETSGEAALLAGALLGGGALAFLLLVVELQLVARTSALTLNVIGHAKDVFVIGLAIPVFHETLTLMSSVGVVLTAAGTVIYSTLKARDHARAAAAARAAAVVAAALSAGGLVRARRGAAHDSASDGDFEQIELLHDRRPHAVGGASVGDVLAPQGGPVSLLSSMLSGRSTVITPEAAARALQRTDLDFEDSDEDDEEFKDFEPSDYEGDVKVEGSSGDINRDNGSCGGDIVT